MLLRKLAVPQHTLRKIILTSLAIGSTLSSRTITNIFPYLISKEPAGATCSTHKS